MQPSSLTHFSAGLKLLGRGFANAYRNLFAHEEQASLRKLIRRAEARGVLLAMVLTRITRELRIYSLSARLSICDSIRDLVKECEASLRAAEYLEEKFSNHKRPLENGVYDQSDADKIDQLIDRLASIIERALVVLRDATLVIRPVSAYSARHVIHQSENVLMMCRPKKPRQPDYVSARVHLRKATQSLRRLAVGIGPIPLVVVFDRHVHPQKAQP